MTLRHQKETPENDDNNKQGGGGGSRVAKYVEIAIPLVRTI